jgi:cobalamin-dependent methionine synthase I
MASDLISERRAEWQAALDIIQPQIRGLEDKVNDALSEALRTVLKERLAFLKQREALIGGAIVAQDAADAAQGALEGHGFPSLPDMEIAGNLLEELDQEVADNLAARSGFDALPIAVDIGISLGDAADKP